MIIIYDPDTLTPWQIVHHADREYLAWLESNSGHSYVMTEERMTPEEIEVIRTPEGVALRRRVPLPEISCETLRVGQERTLSGIPEGVSVFVNGAAPVVMDASGTLEITASTAGFYVFRFEGSGWITREISLEALA